MSAIALAAAPLVAAPPADAAQAAPGPAAAGPELMVRDRVTDAKLSPDGDWISYLAPHGGTRTIWLADRHHPDNRRPLDIGGSGRIATHLWSADSRFVLVAQDATGGGERHHVYAVPVAGGAGRDLTPGPDLRAQLIATSNTAPGLVSTLITLPRQPPNLVNIDIATGIQTQTTENRQYGWIGVDNDLAPRIAIRPLPDGGGEWLWLTGKDSHSLLVMAAADFAGSKPLAIASDGGWVVMQDATAGDFPALVKIDTATGARQVLLRPDQEIASVLLEQHSREVQAVALDGRTPEWRVLDPAVAEPLADLQARGLGFPQVRGRTDKGTLWLVCFTDTVRPEAWYLYDTKTRALTSVLADPAGEPPAGRAMAPVAFTARDGLPLSGYLTRPAQAGAVPLVLLVHGGPWERDRLNWNPLHQWLSGQGYAVLSVNYRGSTGFGKAFTAAGDRQWGGRMQDDLFDAVAWAVDQGIADPTRLCIMGGSYGGYAALNAIATEPQRFACAIDIVGTSDLVSFVEDTINENKALGGRLRASVGDPATPEGRALLAERSPLNRADRIRTPLLIAHGANDPRAHVEQSERLAEKLRDHQSPYTYLVFPDEGHSFGKAGNIVAFYTIAGQFLARHLGPTVGTPPAPVTGALLARSSVEIRGGADRVPGLAEAQASRAAAQAGTQAGAGQ
ncbi:S9 family peptidase [Nitrospirillum sp. BR 11163]|uniref:S9 family peptidase n=1 Tax=Nitrospirillum sp. BR 11163 TaxID=3104323 RepID=UPI002AFF9AEC|nr:S9 family peptidase [Nitrospirillum sp. BR 11163]MEA1676158.1 S9 family peptidase [Nitrospirillum sp. BR 11163]